MQNETRVSGLGYPDQSIKYLLSYCEEQHATFVQTIAFLQDWVLRLSTSKAVLKLSVWHDDSHLGLLQSIVIRGELMRCWRRKCWSDYAGINR